jgi:hypothetical protein
MPSAWIHAVIDLTAYGRPCFDLHKEKDKPHELLGSNHRIVNHDWYQVYGRSWNFREPFPPLIKESIRILGKEKGADRAEEEMAWTDHDYIDRVWDSLSDTEKKYWEGFFAWVLLNPKIFKDWAGADVLNGNIHRVINGYEVWEYCPELRSEYKRLCSYVNGVIKKDKILQDMLRGVTDEPTATQQNWRGKAKVF